MEKHLIGMISDACYDVIISPDNTFIDVTYVKNVTIKIIIVNSLNGSSCD